MPALVVQVDPSMEEEEDRKLELYHANMPRYVTFIGKALKAQKFIVSS